MDTKSKDLDQIESKIELLNEQGKMVNKRLDSEMTYYLSGYITNDKNLEVIRYEDIRVDTGARTYQFKVDEWLDRSDSPETLTMHKNLPFLGLTIN